MQNLLKNQNTALSVKAGEIRDQSLRTLSAAPAGSGKAKSMPVLRLNTGDRTAIIIRPNHASHTSHASHASHHSRHR